LVTIIFSS